MEHNTLKDNQNLLMSAKPSTKPKRIVWRPTSGHVDSGSESHPLLSSDGSFSSRTSGNGHPCSFFDSETSDFEATITTAPRKIPLVKKEISPYRSPFASRYGLEPDLTGFAGGYGFGSNCGAVGVGGGPRFGVTPYKHKYTYDTHFYSYRPHRPDCSTSLSESDNYSLGKHSSLITIFSVWNTTVGTSLLALPWAIEKSGLFIGVLITFAMAGLCLYTAWRLLHIYRIHGTDMDGDVAEVSRKLLGPWGEFVARLFSMIVLLGATLIYWILMSNFLYYSVRVIIEQTTDVAPVADPASHGKQQQQSAFLGTIWLLPVVVSCSTIVVVSFISTKSKPRGKEMGACIVSDARYKAGGVLSRNSSTGVDTFAEYWTPFGTVPLYLVALVAPLLFCSATFFARFNAIGTLCVVYLMVFVLVKSAYFGININLTDVASPFYVPMASWSFPATSGLFGMSFFIHNIIISIMRNNQNQKNNGRDLSIAYILVTCTYIFTGVLFYVCFPLAKACISDNLLNNFELDDPMTVAARLFLFFQLLTVFPLVSSLMRSQFFMWTKGVPNPGGVPSFFFNAGLVSLCVLFAVFLPHIGTIIRYTGALSGMVYIFTLPSLLHLFSLHQRGMLSASNLFIHCFIPIFGLLNLIAQFFVS